MNDFLYNDIRKVIGLKTLMYNAISTSFYDTSDMKLL